MSSHPRGKWEQPLHVLQVTRSPGSMERGAWHDGVHVPLNPVQHPPAVLVAGASLVSIRFVVLLIMEPSLREPTAILSRPLTIRTWAPMPCWVEVSMSTMGGRGHYLVCSLPSLLNQKYPLDRIIVTISKVRMTKSVVI